MTAYLQRKSIKTRYLFQKLNLVMLFKRPFQLTLAYFSSK